MHFTVMLIYNAYFNFKECIILYFRYVIFNNNRQTIVIINIIIEIIIIMILCNY